MKKVLALLILVAIAGVAVYVYNHPKQDPAQVSAIERGRYLVTISGCNDCHTPGYGLNGGKVDEAQWLIGDSLGWQGPWGTTYAINLRQYVQTVTEDQWVQLGRTKPSRPPMPYFALQKMTEEDLRAIYAYIHAAGPAGNPAPPYLPPGVQAATPVVVFPGPPSG